MALLYDVVDALVERRRREHRRRFVLAGAGLVLVLVAVFVWRDRRNVVQAVGSQVGLLRVESFADEIASAAAESEMDPFLLAAIMWSESRGQVDAKSSADAMGLMQLRSDAASDAARSLGIAAPTEAQLRSDAELNIRLGARHLSWLLANSEGWPLERVLVSYNAGRTRLNRWIDEHGSYAAWRQSEFDAEAEGRKSTGALTYAIKTLEMRERFAERGVVRAEG